MSLYENALEYKDAGLKLIRLNRIIQGRCECESHRQPDDTRGPCQAVGKHPSVTKWQLAIATDPAVIEAWIRHYNTEGIGWVLDDKHIIVDVDPRNGGMESLAKLEQDIGIKLMDVCNAVVKTGGDGLHFYFQKDPSQPLSCKMPKEYPGLDVKQKGGYVVIPGSLHKSGSEYDWYSFDKSDIANLSVLPKPITEMLTRARREARKEAEAYGVGDLDDIKDILTYLSPDMSHDQGWLKVGMAIHEATNGSDEGLQAWDTWSQDGKTYQPGLCDYKWSTFGRYAGAHVGIGTLVSMAKDAGWEPSQAADLPTMEEVEELKKKWAKAEQDRIAVPSVLDDADIDIYSPPGLLGKIYKYVYSCSPFDNKNLALACSLVSLGNVIGRRYYLAKYRNIQPNFIALCVAGAGCGKGPALEAARSILRAANIFSAHNGAIISAKDVSDSLEDNQYCFLLMDEFGHLLKQIENASKGGGASHLEGIPKVIMEAFTASSIGLSNRRKKEIRAEWLARINTLKKQIRDGNTGVPIDELQAKLKRAQFMCDIQNGELPKPFLSMITFSTPGTMVTAYNKESAENGFLSRTMAFHENETNPRARPDFTGTPESLPMGLLMAIKAIRFRADECPFGRLDSYEQKQDEILIAEDAQMLLDSAFEYFHVLADEQKENGLESLVRRSKDNVLKVCIALGADLRAVTVEIARYAIKLVMHELNVKISRVMATENINSDDKIESDEGSTARILELCSTADGCTEKHLFNRCKSKKITRDSLPKKLSVLVKLGRLEQIENGSKVKYKTVQLQ